MVTLAIILYALDRFQAPTVVGWVAFASLAPGLAISPLAGALLDRIGAVSAIAIDMFASALLLFVLVAASIGGTMTVPLLLSLVALFSLSSPLSAAAIRVLIPGLVPADSLDRANALDAGSYAVVDVVGPALAGALFGFVGAHWCLLAIGGLYVSAALALLPVGRHSSPSRAAPTGPLLREAAAGVMLRHPSLRGLAVAYSFYQVSIGVLIVVVPILLSRALGPGANAEAATGGLFAAAGLAGGLGALVTGHLRTGNRERHFIALGALATAAALFLLAPCSASADWWWPS